MIDEKKYIRTINGLKVYKIKEDKYILCMPDLSEVIYSTLIYDKKDFEWLANHINYHKGSKECIIENYYNGNELYNGFYDGESMLMALYNFNTKHNIVEIYDDEWLYDE